MEQYTILGKTGLRVSRLGFGCIRFNSIPEVETTAALNRALDLGVNFLDTARNYGTSEKKVGIALRGQRDRFVLATKTVNRTAEGVRQELETSLRELQTDHIDLYQLHTVSSPSEYERAMGPGGALQEARKAQQEGKVRFIGVSVHRSLETMKKCITSGAFATIMVAYSAIDQENVEAEILPLARRQGVGVVIMKPLSGGQLALKPPAATAQVVRGCLRYVLSNEAVSVCCPGMASVREVEENVATWKIEDAMAKAERDELVKSLGAFKKAYRYGQVCLRCGYCQPCPQGIDVPTVFRAHDMIREYPEELKYEGWRLLLGLPVLPDVCESCGECMKKCPAGLKIPDRLKEIVALLKARKGRQA